MSITEKTGGKPGERPDGTPGSEPGAASGKVPGQASDRDDLGAAGAQLSTAPADTLSEAPGIGVLGWLRWMWRQLTSMRTALILLFLLSLAAIPGSLIPQRSDQLKVDAFKSKHPTVSPLYERLGLFHVFSSPWFSAIYILLFVSLAGCIIPRSWQFVGQLRAKPPAAPRNLTRLPAYSTWRTDASPEAVTEAARKVLRGRRFRTSVTGSAVSGEKGYLREFGNLVFHISLFGLLIAFALTSLERAEGGKLIVEGDGFVNNLTQYDDFSPGTLYTADDLQPFGFTLDSFDQKYATSGPEIGTALKFQANIHYYTGTDDTKATKGTISINHPLSIGGEKVYLISHGYAPVVTVTDGQGHSTQSIVPFLPQDSAQTSVGVIKAPDSYDKNGKLNQLGFRGIFAPTAAPVSATRGWYSTFPTLLNPTLVLNAWHGDLGMDSGAPQNVYKLDEKHLKQYEDSTGKPLAKALRPGDTMTLPDGAGTLRFDGIKTWASFTVTHQSGNVAALVAGVGAILGLAGSLFIQRRRIWVRAVAAEDGAGTVVEMGGLGRSESARIADELGEVALTLLPDAPPSAPPDGDDGDGTPAPKADNDDEGARA